LPPGPGSGRLPAAVFVVAAAVFVLEVAAGPRYGLFRDEYYYLTCADHLAWGYVDHPPLSIAVLAAVKAVLGDSLPAIRLVPALLGALLVVLGGALARVMGGGRFASVLFFGAGMAVALLVTPLRRLLRRPGPWLAAGLALVLFLPHLAWQVRSGWPTREFIENATRHKNVAMDPLSFLAAQVLEIHTLNAPLWVAGLAWLLFSGRGRAFRALGIVYVVAFAIIVAQHGKPYYLGPAYPPLLAAGAIVVEGLQWRRLRPAVVAALLLGGAALAPFAIPLLPVERFVAYQKALGLSPPQAERHAQGPLPQFFADRFGWVEMTEAVDRVYRSLPPDEQARVVIVASNYGEAGALRYHGRRFGLPPAVSPHNSFYFWGPGRDSVDVAIVVGMSPESLREAWAQVEEASRFSSPWAMPYEQRWPILVCRGLKLPLREAWAAARRFI
jgi:hypothetical protein